MESASKLALGALLRLAWEHRHAAHDVAHARLSADGRPPAATRATHAHPAPRDAARRARLHREPHAVPEAPPVPRARGHRGAARAAQDL